MKDWKENCEFQSFEIFVGQEKRIIAWIMEDTRSTRSPIYLRIPLS